jgi:hypothetical protein
MLFGQPRGLETPKLAQVMFSTSYAQKNVILSCLKRERRRAWSFEYERTPGKASLA